MDEQIVHRPNVLGKETHGFSSLRSRSLRDGGRRQPLRTSLGLACGGLGKARPLAVECEPFAQGVPEAGVEALEKGGVERSFAPRFGFPDRPVGLEQEIAHGSRPRLMIEFDQRFEFAQVVGVAERVARRREGAIGFEAVVDDHAAGKSGRHVAPLVLRRGRA
jgi:hypothetical protein